MKTGKYGELPPSPSARQNVEVGQETLSGNGVPTDTDSGFQLAPPLLVPKMSRPGVEPCPTATHTCLVWQEIPSSPIELEWLFAKLGHKLNPQATIESPNRF